MHTDYMGWFGLSWEEKIASDMYSNLGKSYKSTLKRFGQPGGWNIRLIKNLHGNYLLYKNTDVNATNLSIDTSVSKEIAQAFLLSLRKLAVRGDIPYKYFDPYTVSEISTVKKDILVPEAVKTTKKYVTVGALLLGGIIAINLLSTIKPKG